MVLDATCCLAVSYSPKMLLATPDSSRAQLLPQSQTYPDELVSFWLLPYRTLVLHQAQDCCHTSFSGSSALVLNTPHLLLVSLCTLLSHRMYLKWARKTHSEPKMWMFLKVMNCLQREKGNITFHSLFLSMHAQHNPEVSLLISSDQSHYAEAILKSQLQVANSLQAW